MTLNAMQIAAILASIVVASWLVRRGGRSGIGEWWGDGGGGLLLDQDVARECATLDPEQHEFLLGIDGGLVERGELFQPGDVLAVYF